MGGAWNKVFFVVFGIAFLGAGFFMFAPETRVQSVKEMWSRKAKDPAQLCLDHFRPTFVDPESVKIVNSKVVNGTTWLTFAASNRMGGRSTENHACPMFGEVFDETSAIDEVGPVLDAQTRCVKRQIAWLRATQAGKKGLGQEEECSEAKAWREVREGPLP